MAPLNIVQTVLPDQDNAAVFPHEAATAATIRTTVFSDDISLPPSTVTAFGHSLVKISVNIQG